MSKEVDITKKIGKALIKNTVSSKSRPAWMDVFDIGMDIIRGTMNSEAVVETPEKVFAPKVATSTVRVKEEKVAEVKNCTTCEFKTKIDVLLEGQLWCIEHGEVVETKGSNGCGCGAWKKSIKEF